MGEASAHDDGDDDGDPVASVLRAIAVGMTLRAPAAGAQRARRRALLRRLTRGSVLTLCLAAVVAAVGVRLTRSLSR